MHHGPNIVSEVLSSHMYGLLPWTALGEARVRSQDIQSILCLSMHAKLEQSWKNLPYG